MKTESAQVLYRKLILLGLLLTIIWQMGCQPKRTSRLEAMVIVNSQSPDFNKWKEMLLPYLDHFGLPYYSLNLASEKPADKNSDHPLIIIAHPGIVKNLNNERLLNTFLEIEMRNGSGLVCFDPELDLLEVDLVENSRIEIDRLTFGDKHHFILGDQAEKDTLSLFGSMHLPKYNFNGFRNLVENDGNALLN